MRGGRVLRALMRPTSRVAFSPSRFVQSGMSLNFRSFSTAKAEAKTPEQLIAEIPPIEVEGDIAICYGGDYTSSHPVEYIQLNKAIFPFLE
eukprot:CAMPEP_0167747886 /NCGR_PEP_ID=MMETSP0110_2-20121227/4532_1 /TAXON_ID=629695 /ORGANISM="Gymnochlora sp., Strain CCMP2014" /LENGTH=90 /DNA_ID=CAMNT_0007632841 /DNA_START=16 /DNA_END=288 /DNA_ORIENTATION=+